MQKRCLKADVAFHRDTPESLDHRGNRQTGWGNILVPWKVVMTLKLCSHYRPKSDFFAYPDWFQEIWTAKKQKNKKTLNHEICFLQISFEQHYRLISPSRRSAAHVGFQCIIYILKLFSYWYWQPKVGDLMDKKSQRLSSVSWRILKLTNHWSSSKVLSTTRSVFGSDLSAVWT